MLTPEERKKKKSLPLLSSQIINQDTQMKIQTIVPQKQNLNLRRIRSRSRKLMTLQTKLFWWRSSRTKETLPKEDSASFPTITWPSTNEEIQEALVLVQFCHSNWKAEIVMGYLSLKCRIYRIYHIQPRSKTQSRELNW